MKIAIYETRRLGETFTQVTGVVDAGDFTETRVNDEDEFVD